MITLVVAAEPQGEAQAQGTQRPERGHDASGLGHRVAIRRRHREGPEAVQQDVGADPGPAALGERAGDLLADRAFLVEVLSVTDRPARGANGLQLRGKDLIAVQEQARAVAAVGRGRVGLDGRKERRLLRRQVREREVRLYAEEGHPDEQPDVASTDHPVSTLRARTNAA
jgi:hypothetical protein